MQHKNEWKNERNFGQCTSVQNAFRIFQLLLTVEKRVDEIEEGRETKSTAASHV